MTSESWTSQNRWSTIGFYPDLVSASGYSTDNTIFAPAELPSNNSSNNVGLVNRLKYILNDTGETYSGDCSSYFETLIDKTEIAKHT